MSSTGILQVFLFVLWVLQQRANHRSAEVPTASVLPAGGGGHLWIQPDGCHKNVRPRSTNAGRFRNSAYISGDGF